MSRLTFAATLLLAVSSSSVAQQASFTANDTGPSADAIFETKDAAIATAGPLPLSQVHRLRGQREVRVWYLGFGTSQSLVICHQNGSKQTGRMMLWWDQYYVSTPASAR